MKKLLCILCLAFALQVSAQEQVNWLTDHKVALQQSEVQNKPILAYVTNGQKSEASALLDKDFFGSEAFAELTSKLVFLKLDVSDTQSYNARMGIHYIKQTSAPGLALVNKYNDTVMAPLNEITPEQITEFLAELASKLQ